MPPVKLGKAAAAALAALPPAERAGVAARLRELPVSFGQPHRHSGLGIRKLRGSVYECRASRDLRVVFLWREGELRIEMLGDHDAVRHYLRSRAR